MPARVRRWQKQRRRRRRQRYVRCGVGCGGLQGAAAATDGQSEVKGELLGRGREKNCGRGREKENCVEGELRGRGRAAGGCNWDTVVRF